MVSIDDFPMVRDKEGWIVDTWLISTDGRFRLYIFDTDGVFYLSWCDFSHREHDDAYSHLFKGSLSDCLMTLDSLTHFPGITDHSRSVIYVRHGFSFPRSVICG